jgi:hypothetical protein
VSGSDDGTVSGFGYRVDPDALKDAADGINAAIGALKPLGIGGSADEGRGFSQLQLSGLQAGDAGVQSALAGFCDRWSWGVRTLVQDGDEIASRLGLNAGLYYDQEQYASRALKDVVASAIGNPHLTDQQVESESWNQVLGDNPITQAEHPDYSVQSFEQAAQNSAKVWAGEKTDLEQLAFKAALPGVGQGIVDAQHTTHHG